MEEGQASHNTTEVKVADKSNVATPPLPPPPGRPQHDMYIVQFPKDQVYHVPPRENALIMEKYRKPQTTAKKRRYCCCGSRFLLTLALIIVSIVAILGITLATLYFIFKPKGPTFAVSDVMMKNKTSQPQFEVSLRAKNSNPRLGVDYENGDVSLVFEGNKEIATGKFPSLEQDRGESSQVKVELNGSNRPLPKGIIDDKGKSPVALKLEMKLGVRVTIAGLKTWVMMANVVCNFKVIGLGKDTRVLSQQCDTNFKQHY